MWPFVDGHETKRRYKTAYDPAADRAHGAFDFYGTPDHRARIWLRPYEPPAEAPDEEYPFWLVTGRVLEHWHTGSLTRRIPTLHRAVPAAYVELNREDAAELGIRDRERVRLVTQPRRARARGAHRLPCAARAPPGLRAVLRRGAAGERAHAGRVRPDLRPAGLQEVRGAGRASGSARGMTGWRG